MSELRNLTRFLRRSGWTEQGHPNERIVILNSPQTSDGDFATVVLPRTEEFADTGRRVEEAKSTVSEFLDIPLPQLVQMLRKWDRDILRTRFFDRAAEIDVIPLKLASLVIDDLRSFVGYAAYSQQAPRPFFAKSGAIATDFTEHCYFGHTFRGSFGLTIECPLPAVGQMTITEDLREPPFERLVMQRIAHGYRTLNRAKDAEDPSLLVSDFEQGMNANMLRALTAVYERLDTLGVEYRMEWSPELTPPRELLEASQFRFDGRVYELAKHAAVQLEAEEAPQEAVIVSHVVSLKAELPLDDGVQEQFDQIITLDWERQQGMVVRIRVALPREEYRKACDAHKNGRRIRVTGRPIKAKKFWILQNPSEVTFVV